jgi:hypothetical protein
MAAWQSRLTSKREAQAGFPLFLSTALAMVDKVGLERYDARFFHHLGQVNSEDSYD